MKNNVREKLEGLLIMSGEAPKNAHVASAAAPMWASYAEDAVYAGRALCFWWFAPKLNDENTIHLKITNPSYKSLIKLIKEDTDLASIFEVDGELIRFRAETGLHPKHEDIKALAHLCATDILPPRIPLKRPG